MKEIFAEKQVPPYGLRGCPNLNWPKARTMCYGIETILSIGCRIWQALPNSSNGANGMVHNPSKFQVILLGFKCIDNIVLEIEKVSIYVVNSTKGSVIYNSGYRGGLESGRE